MIIRPAGVIDAAVLAALHAQAFPEEPWPRLAFVTLLADPCTEAMILDTGNAEMPVPAGLGLIRVAADEGEIITFGVAPGRRRRGLGLALLEACCRRAAARGAASLFLEVAETNEPACRLYARHGFLQVGRRPGYYRRGKAAPVDALVLRLDLPAAPIDPVRRDGP